VLGTLVLEETVEAQSFAVATVLSIRAVMEECDLETVHEIPRIFCRSCCVDSVDSGSRNGSGVRGPC